MSKFFKRLHKDESGVTAIEYGLIAALIAVVIIVAVTLVGGELNSVFNVIQSSLSSATGAGPAPAPAPTP